MASFYGGKDGRSFVIAKEFQSIAEMTEAFRQGPDYTEVNFDEYVLINTVNKNSPENGQLFRRGYDFNSDRMINTYHLGVQNPGTEDQKAYYIESINAGGAIYVGTIVGPAGRAPRMNFGLYSDIEEFRAVYTIEDNSNDKDITTMIQHLNTTYPEGISANEQIYYFVKWVVDESEYYFALDKDLYNQDIAQSIGWYSIDTLPKTGADSFNLENDLVPAVKYSKEMITDDYGRNHKQIESYQDTIDWIYCTVRNENGEDSTAHLGFRIPSPVIELEAESVDPYYGRNDGGNSRVFTNVNLADEQDTSTHPFYFKWNLKIPRGIKGDSLQNIRVIEASNDVVTFALDKNGNLQYNEDGTIITTSYEGQSDDVIYKRQILVGDYRCYDRLLEGETYLIYLGDYNQIFDISFKDDGTVDIIYTHDDAVSYSKLINWIKTFTFDENVGKLDVTFNNDNIDPIDASLQWVKDISFSSDGSIEIDYSNIDNKTLFKLINWISNFTFDKESGALEITFNNDNISKISHVLNYVKKMELTDTNHLIITHSDPALGEVDLGAINSMVAAPEENELVKALPINGIWFVTQEIEDETV